MPDWSLQRLRSKRSERKDEPQFVRAMLLGEAVAGCDKVGLSRRQRRPKWWYSNAIPCWPDVLLWLWCNFELEKGNRSSRDVYVRSPTLDYQWAIVVFLHKILSPAKWNSLFVIFLNLSLDQNLLHCICGDCLHNKCHLETNSIISKKFQVLILGQRPI